MSKILTVFGATGNQGGSVIKTVLAHPELSKTYKIRAITRDVSKPAAVALKDQGAELVTANLDDKESVKKAVEGSSVVFGVTNFWETLDGPKETQQGKNIADAAKAANVDRFIFSSIPNVTKATNGANTRLVHFDSKARVEEYAREIGVPGSYFMPACFVPMLLDNLKPNDSKDTYTWTGPMPADTKIPIIDPAVDTGKFVGAILLNLDKTLGARILGASEYVTPNEVVAQFGEVTGKKGAYNKITYDQFKGFLPPAIAEELVATFKYIDSPGYYTGEPADALEKSIKLVKESAGLGEPTTWKSYVKANFKA